MIEPWNPIPPPNLSVGSYVEDIRRKPEPEWNPLAAHTTVSAVVVETDSNDLFAGFTAPDFSAND
ncbi:hypothetical protein ACFYY5_01355 [Nocardia elegans]|uniref:Uncharacterized protein n=1 Tax=Nocardia elegans TaxID=300029 RepID=A0ABW6T5S2_9NOCA